MKHTIKAPRANVKYQLVYTVELEVPGEIDEGDVSILHTDLFEQVEAFFGGVGDSTLSIQKAV